MELPMRFTEALVLALIAVVVWCSTIVTTARSTTQFERKKRDGFFTAAAKRPIGWELAAYTASFVVGGVFGEVIAQSMTTASQGEKHDLPFCAAVLAIWMTFIVIQIVTNIGRRIEGLQTEPLRVLPERRQPPALSSSQQSLIAETEDLFAAMELGRFYWNRFYGVFIRDGMLCGAKARFARFSALNITLNSRGIAKSLTFDPIRYVTSLVRTQYKGVDITQPAFLAIDHDNFQLMLKDIVSINLASSETIKERAGLGLGGLRQSGALAFILGSHGTRELILLGDQDAVTLRNRLSRLIASSAAD